MYGSAASIALELITIALLVIGIISGVKKGFFKSLMDLVILIAAVIAAVMVCRWCTGFFVERIYPKAEEKVLSAIESAEMDLSNVDISAMNFGEDHPDTLSDEEYALLKQNAGIAKFSASMEKVGIPESRIRAIIAKTIKNASRSGESFHEAVTDSAKAVTRNTVKVIVQIVLFLIVLIVLVIVLQLLVNGIRGLMWKADLIKSVDRFLGFLLGALMMLALIFIAFYLFRRLNWTAFENAADETLFAAFLNVNNPLTLFFD